MSNRDPEHKAFRKLRNGSHAEKTCRKAMDAAEKAQEKVSDLVNILATNNVYSSATDCQLSPLIDLSDRLFNELRALLCMIRHDDDADLMPADVEIGGEG
jgi:hypothetical protein